MKVGPTIHLYMLLLIPRLVIGEVKRMDIRCIPQYRKRQLLCQSQ